MARMFLDKNDKPDEKKLAEALGRSYNYWRQIQSSLHDLYGDITPEWKYYGAKAGWTLKMILRKRNLFFFGPCDKYFRIAFVFGDKAVGAIEQSDLPPVLIAEIKNAKKYAEGRGLRIELKKKEQIEDVLKLVAIKVSN